MPQKEKRACPSPSQAPTPASCKPRPPLRRLDPTWPVLDARSAGFRCFFFPTTRNPGPKPRRLRGPEEDPRHDDEVPHQRPRRRLGRICQDPGILLCSIPHHTRRHLSRPRSALFLSRAGSCDTCVLGSTEAFVVTRRRCAGVGTPIDSWWCWPWHEHFLGVPPPRGPPFHFTSSQSLFSLFGRLCTPTHHALPLRPPAWPIRFCFPRPSLPTPQARRIRGTAS